MAVKTVHISNFFDSDQETRKGFAIDLRDALIRDGFVKIKGHGIAEEDIRKAFQWNRKFFGLDFNQKAAIAHQAGPDPQRGWSAVGAENASSLYRSGYLGVDMSKELKDSREHFDQGSRTDPSYPNRWPREEDLPGFQAFMEQWYERLGEVTANIMSALEVAFNLPTGSFGKRMSKHANASEARLLHYPSIDMEVIRKGSVSRIWPHFDLGVITLLFQDGLGGLECEDRTQPGTFKPIECGAASEMIVNVSETLQRWTNNVLPAGLHRVTVPPQFQNLESGLVPERFSITYFGKADRDASVGPLPQFISEASAPKYEDMTAIQYHQSRLQSAY